MTSLDENGSAHRKSLMLANADKKNQMTYSQWQKAFYIFAYVYCQAYPQDVAHIFKYADNIRELFAVRARWQYYDEHFRRARARAPQMMPWQNLQMELWGKAMAIFRDSNEQDRPSTSRDTRVSFHQSPGPARQTRTPNTPNDRSRPYPTNAPGGGGGVTFRLLFRIPPGRPMQQTGVPIRPQVFPLPR